MKKNDYSETGNLTEDEKKDRRVRKTCFTMLGIVFILLGIGGFVYFILDSIRAVSEGEFPKIWLIFISFPLFIGGILTTIFTWVSFFPYAKIKVYAKRKVTEPCAYCGVEYNKYMQKCPYCTAPRKSENSDDETIA